MKKELLDNRTGNTSEVKTYFEVKKKNSFLEFYFEAFDSSLNSYSNKDNDALYNGDVVEVFLDLGFEDYFEFEVAPNGATFVATIKNIKPTFISRDFFKSDVVIVGNNYYVKINLDLSKFDYKFIKFNAFRIETKRIRSNYILQALSPTLTNSFHVREKFVELS